MLSTRSFLKIINCQMKMSTKAIIGVCQMSVGGDKDINFKQGKKLIEDCVERGVKMCFLPESSDFIAQNGKESIELSEVEGLNGGVLDRYSKLALHHKIWISMGIHLYDKDTEKSRNSHVIIDDEGVVRNIYEKCHLFDISLPNKVSLRESDYVKAGSSLPDPLPTPCGVLAPMICYDLRFPQISSEVTKRGAEILTFPSAFTVPTGNAHWEVLLRSRAIENQCYVIAAAQCGRHNDKRTSFGHSLVVDPWGTVIACKGEEVGIITAEIDLDHVSRIRTSMPVLQHRRNDLY